MTESDFDESDRTRLPGSTTPPRAEPGAAGQPFDAPTVIAVSARDPIAAAPTQPGPFGTSAGTEPWAAAAPDTPTITVGTLLSHTYRIEALIARGGMGEVYRARHQVLDTLHAVKVVLPHLAKDPKLVNLFRREASVLRQVRHDAVVAYDGINRDEFGRLYLVMEYVEGPSLTHVLQQGQLPEAQVAVLLDRIAAGLAAAHEKGVVHRDISPDNIILPSGRVEEAKIIDFGISKQTTSNAATIIGEGFAGKYAFASPEQIGMFGGAVDERSDIYSVGLVLAAAALGRPVDMGNSPSTVIQRRMEVPDLSGIGQPLRDVLTGMLTPDPDQRIQDIADLIGVCTGAGAWSAAPPPPPPRPLPPAGPNTATTPPPAAPRTKQGGGLPLPALAGVAAALLLTGGSAFYFLGGSPAPTPTVSAPAPVAAVAPVPAPQPVQYPPAVAPESVQPKPAPPQAEAEPPRTGTAVVHPPPLPVPAPLQYGDVHAVVDEAARLLPCSGLATQQLGDSHFRVAGYVGSDADGRLLRERLDRLAPRGTLEQHVSVRPWPFCEVLGIAAPPHKAPAADTVHASLNHASAVYRDGETLMVNVKAGARGGHLTVDYLDLDGNAIHMVPMRLRRDGRIAAGQSITLGASPTNAGKDQRVYSISAPFGPSMILVMLTHKPLFAADRPEVERAADYLPKLRSALAQVGTGADDVSTETLFFNTVPR